MFSIYLHINTQYSIFRYITGQLRLNQRAGKDQDSFDLNWPNPFQTKSILATIERIESNVYASVCVCLCVMVSEPGDDQ